MYMYMYMYIYKCTVHSLCRLYVHVHVHVHLQVYCTLIIRLYVHLLWNPSYFKNAILTCMGTSFCRAASEKNNNVFSVGMTVRMQPYQRENGDFLAVEKKRKVVSLEIQHNVQYVTLHDA